MQALNVAAILLTGSACSVLLLQARNRLLIYRIPALVIFLLLDLPLYGILLYLHADTAEALLRSRAVLGGGFAIGCIVIALLFQRRKKALLSYGGELVSVTASLQLFTLLYTGAALLYLHIVQASGLTREICMMIMEHVLLFSMVSCFLCLLEQWFQVNACSEALRQLHKSRLRIRQKK